MNIPNIRVNKTSCSDEIIPTAHYIKNVIDKVVEKNITVVSFDFFDTFVYRLSDDPRPLFIEVGRRLKLENLISEHISEMDFFSLRQQAEVRARKKALLERKNAECSLEEIYCVLKGLILDPRKAASIEVDTEHDFCFVNPEISELALSLAKSGKIIGIVSDTYLNANVLKSILDFNGFPSSHLSFIITSCQHGVCKVTGDLFKILLKQLEVKPEKYLHIGDNEESDYRGALRAGLKSIHYSRRLRWQETVLMREQALLDNSYQSASMNAFRRVASRECDHIPNAYRPYFVIGAFLFGPCLARFIDWCVDVIIKEKVSTVFVLMREAYTLLPLLQHALAQINVKVECKSLYVSRHAVNLASLNDINASSLFEKTTKHRTATPRQILQSLELPFDTVKEIPEELMDEPINSVERLTLCRLLSTHPRYKYALHAIAKDKRERFLSYMKPYIGNEKKIVFIDLGFRGSTQKSIDMIFEYYKIPIKTIGLYFCTHSAAANYVLDGSDIRSYLGNLGAYDKQLGVFMCHPEALEASIIAPVGTTVGYRYNDKGQTWEPILENIDISSTQRAMKQFTREGILAFYRLWLIFRMSRQKRGSFLSSNWLNEIDSQVALIVRRLFSYPTKEEAECLGSLYHEDNNGTSTGDYVVDYSSRRLFRDRGFSALKEKFVYWPHGLVGLEAQNILDKFFEMKNVFEHPQMI